MKSVRKPIVTLALCWVSLHMAAQQYTGMSGLIHLPSADMDQVAVARVGGHFLNREFTPDHFVFDKKKYHTFTHYLSITPFSWIELGYTCTLRKGINNSGSSKGLGRKDRYFSLKVQPLKEGTYRPAVAIGTNDPYTTDDKGSGNKHFRNFYVAASKHLNLKNTIVGAHIAYRKFDLSANKKWNGMVGGITCRPAFENNLRLIAEYTGSDINIGFDWKLLKYFLVQSSLQNGKYFTGGICLHINLL